MRNAHLQRAMLLLDQQRYDLAETELQQAIGIDPDDPHVHACYAICLAEMDQHKRAQQAAQNAIKLGPDYSFSFYAAAQVALSTNQFKPGLQWIDQALQLDPDDEDALATKSSLHLQLKQWPAALAAANLGLEIDPEHIGCLNLRAQALVKMGNQIEAGDSIESALQRQPNSAVTHANRGWTLLENGQAKPAMEHFREALRLEPNMEWARLGIVESMKGQYFIYRIVLGWFLWCSKLTGQKLWMIVLGGYFGYRVLWNLAANVPAARPFVIPLIALYIGFVVMTWVSVPLFNLMLRLNRFGRLALSDPEKRTSTWVGVCLLTAVGVATGYFFIGGTSFLFTALGIVLMVPALATYYASDEGWPRAAHGLLLCVMVFLSLCSLVGMTFYAFASEPWSIFGDMLRIYANLPLLILGFVGQFGVQFLVMANPPKGSNAGFWVWAVGGTLAALLALAFLAGIALVAVTQA